MIGNYADVKTFNFQHQNREVDNLFNRSDMDTMPTATTEYLKPSTNGLNNPSVSPSNQ